jgi:hypothetical protein
MEWRILWSYLQDSIYYAQIWGKQQIILSIAILGQDVQDGNIINLSYFNLMFLYFL